MYRDHLTASCEQGQVVAKGLAGGNAAMQQIKGCPSP
jgi:hypothetical protein